jgi:hypothetical protein
LLTSYWPEKDRFLIFKLISILNYRWFIMFMLSSFRDLLQVSGFIDIPVSFTILNLHLIHLGIILLQVMLRTIKTMSCKM